MTSLLLRRVAAYSLDAALLFIILAPLGVLVQYAIGYMPEMGREIWYSLLINISLPSWLYFIYCDRSTRGATIGKRVVKLQVRTTDDERLGARRAVARTAVKLLPWELVHFSAFAISSDPADFSYVQISGLILANILVLCYLGIAIASGGRASIHDLAASTQVARERRNRPARSLSSVDAASI